MFPGFTAALYYGVTAVPAPILVITDLNNHPVDFLAVLDAVGYKVPALFCRKIAVGVYGGEPFFCGGCAENRPAILLRFVD